MNEAAKLVTDAVIGNRYKTIVAGRKVYTIYSPCIKVICRALNEFSHIELPGSDTMIGFLSGIGEITPYLVRGVAALIAGNVDNWEQERDRIAAELEEATPEELNRNFDKSDERQGFFRLCRLDDERSDNGGKTEVNGNCTAIGQIATFMETLHLTYKEVLEIPYENLLLMQKDKLHAVYGTKIEHKSGKEILKYKKRK